MELLRQLLTPALAPLLNRGAALAVGRFHRRNPVTTQRELLFHLLRKGSATRFGIDHGFASLLRKPWDQAYDDYRRSVPIRNYADFWRDYFGAGYSDNGGRKSLELDNVTWPGRVRLFCETSGTTAPTKYIHFTPEMFAANQRAARDLVAHYLAAVPGNRLLRGRFLYLSGCTELSSLGTGVESGDMSAITLRHAPSSLRSFVAPSAKISALPWGSKVEALTELLLSDGGITGISGVPPWILLLLERVRVVGGKSLPELLPNLELIIHGGTSMAPYRREFDKLFGHRPPRFLELLPSSEGFMGFQLPGEEEMRFTPYYGVFFEFVPFCHLDGQGGVPPDAPSFPLEEVRCGERYAIIMSTCAGLWRYHIGDTIRFTSLAPLAFQFTGRDRFLDRFEEKVTQGEVDKAVAEVNREGVAEIVEFMVGPVIGERRHLWILAVRGTSLPEEQLAELLDGKLMTLNADYAAFRRQGRIHPPTVVTVAEDAIYRWSREVRGKLGGQSKIPHIDPTPEGELVRSLAAFARE